MADRIRPRIISLLPSSTEIVCALGFESHLVGRSHECDFPPSVLRLPVCTEPKFHPSGTSQEIDEQVQRILLEALSVYRIKGELLRQLSPDLIITQTQCEVCAVSLRDVEDAVCKWLDSPARIVSLEATNLSGVWRDMEGVSQALGAPERGEALVEGLKKRMAAIAERTSTLKEKPSLLCVEWIHPLMAAGNWIPELVEMAGGVPVFGVPGKHSPRITWEELKENDPDVILVVPCGFDIARSRKEISQLIRKPGWADLKAVRKGRVYLADGNQYFNRPGPRLVETLEILAEILHPQIFSFGHSRSGWQSL